jgi:Secretion system C-terminal sorting domain/Pregnancy-associated plasma protein-A
MKLTSTAAKNYFVDNAYKLSSFANDPAPPLFYDLAAENIVPNALNVYLGPSTNANDGGIASPSRLACTIAGTRAESSGSNYLVTSHALSHEVAHLLGFFHTFQRQTGENTSVLPLVNGQVCGTTGDLVCDTPVDPTQAALDRPNPFNFRPLLSNCVWNNTTKVDPNGTLYKPSTSNIMAYTHVSCMANFTEGQFRRMHDYCLNNQYVQPAVTIYTVNWFGSCGGGGTSSFKAVVKTEELKFSVFPNPATEFLSVRFLSDSKETALQITDVMGKSLYLKSLGRTTRQDVHEIDFNALPKGIHILTVSNELDKKTSKIVIQ